MDNTSTASFNVSDFLPPQESDMECNMSAGCDVNDGNQTGHLFDSILQITEITFTCFDIINVLGNAVLMLLIYKASTKMEASGRLLTNQAVADAGIGLSWLVLYGIMYSNPHRDVMQAVMLVQRVVMVVLHCESILSLAMTLFTLHIAICNPVSYKIYLQRKHITVFIAVSWLVATGTWNLAFAADNFFILERDSIIAQLNLTEQNVWFASLAMIINIVLPLFTITIAYTRICLFMRKEENTSITSASATMRYVRQAKGILLVCITYMVTFVPLFIFDFFKGYFKGDNAVALFISGTSLAFLNYVYLVFKLPLFLLAFPSYRRVASQIIFQRQRSVASSLASYRREKSNSNKHDASGLQPAVEDARSTPIQMDETTEIKGNIGRVNHGFTSSTCSVNRDDTATRNGADDGVTSSTIDDISPNIINSRPVSQQGVNFEGSG